MATSTANARLHHPQPTRVLHHPQPTYEHSRQHARHSHQQHARHSRQQHAAPKNGIQQGQPPLPRAHPITSRPGLAPPCRYSNAKHKRPCRGALAPSSPPDRQTRLAAMGLARRRQASRIWGLGISIQSSVHTPLSGRATLRRPPNAPNPKTQKYHQNKNQKIKKLLPRSKNACSNGLLKRPLPPKGRLKGPLVSSCPWQTAGVASGEPRRSGPRCRHRRMPHHCSWQS